MKKSIISLLLLISLLILLSGCGNKDQSDQTISQDTNNQKPTSTGSQVFYIDTITLSGLDQTVMITKVGKLMGSSDITISSQIMGTVSHIRVKEGDKVTPGRVLVSLSDSIGNYGIQVQRAKIALERTQLNYQQSQLQLDKAIIDANNSLRQAENNYIITKEKLGQQLQQGEVNLKNAQLSGTSTALEIQKIETELNNQLQSYKNSFQTQKFTIKQLRTDILNQVDKLLGLTNLYKSAASQWQYLISATNVVAKNVASELFYEIKNKYPIDNLPDVPSSDEKIISSIKQLESMYVKLGEMLDILDVIIDNSLTGPGLTSTQLTAFESDVNALRNAHEAKRASFVTYQNQINNIFINKENTNPGSNTTYQQQIAIVTKNAEIGLENAKLAYNQTVTQSKDSLFQIELARNIAKENLATAQKNKDLQLSLLKNAIADAQIAYIDASKQYNKLQITSPINGYIQEVLVDKGQDVSMSTPAIKLMGTENNEIIIAADEDEIQYLSIGQKVQTSYLGKNYTGTITAIGNVADLTLSYPVTLRVDETIGQLGGSISVQIPLTVDGLVLPLNTIELMNNGKAIIYLRNNESLEAFQVDLGPIRANKVVIKTTLPLGVELITTNMLNYDPSKFTIQKRDPYQTNTTGDVL